ncbi:MAG: glycosyltransferase [Candidatus Helarchaeota archaeon]|nr:glycosyltransferase [Candidatus Helarchaeota archaeon]
MITNTSTPRISVTIPTRDRPNDLSELLSTLLNQSYPPIEVIIVDDSLSKSTKNVAHSFNSRFKSIGCELKYVKGSGDGLPAARNLGITIFRGDAILFLDDDTLLVDSNVILMVAKFLKGHPEALGVQPKIIAPRNAYQTSLFSRIEGVLNTVFLLSSYESNKKAIHRSGASIDPKPLTRVITAQILSGCCCLYRRSVFDKFRFDENLKKWANTEDKDFSYRVYKRHPSSLYVFPYAKIVHKESQKAELPKKQVLDMMVIYFSYTFFKDFFEGSILNLFSFLWCLVGLLVTMVAGLIIRRKPKREWCRLIYLFESYVTAFRNLKNILMQRLEFFNKNLNR